MTDVGRVLWTRRSAADFRSAGPKGRRTGPKGPALLLLAAVAALACGRGKSQPAPAQPHEQHVVWRPLGAWSGHGNIQTESFTSDTGTLRVKWQADAVAGAEAPSFKLDAHSAISGRLLQPVVDQGGPGSGIGYVQQDPHVFYMVVEVSQVNWKFTVEEAIGYP